MWDDMVIVVGLTMLDLVVLKSLYVMEKRVWALFG